MSLVRRELWWLLALLGIAVISVALLVSGNPFSEVALDIPLHDTYLVITPGAMTAAIFTGLIIMRFCVRLCSRRR